MSNLREQLELLEVTYDESGKKATLTFLDLENGQLVEVNFNKRIYENGKWVDNKEKGEKVDEWCEEYFSTTFDKLTDCVGMKKDVYVYPEFASLWETQFTEKFELSDKGRIIETVIERIEDDGKGVHIYFKWNDKEYESKMMYSDYVEVRKEWFVNPVKKNKQYEKFKNLFGVGIEDKDSLAGKEIKVEVSVAFGKFPYGEIKKPDWA